MARRMHDLEAPEAMVLASRNSKTRPTIVRRFRKSRRVASPPPSLVANSAVARPRSSLVPSPGTKLSQTSGRSDSRRSIGTSESREPSASRIMFGTNCTTPLSSVVVTISQALVLSWIDSSMATVRSTRVDAVEAMLVRRFRWRGG